MWSALGKSASYNGILVPGDPDLPEPRWWHAWWPGYRSKRKIVVFEVQADQPYFVGYRDARGQVFLRVEHLIGTHFNVLARPDDRIYFALNEHDIPVKISRVACKTCSEQTLADGTSL